MKQTKNAWSLIGILFANLFLIQPALGYRYLQVKNDIIQGPVGGTTIWVEAYKLPENGENYWKSCWWYKGESLGAWELKHYETKNIATIPNVKAYLDQQLAAGQEKPQVCLIATMFLEKFATNPVTAPEIGNMPSPENPGCQIQFISVAHNGRATATPLCDYIAE